MAAAEIRLAMDYSVRTRDANGYLHVSVTNISKANVCPYTGNEIIKGATNGAELGLEPNRIYQLYRDPAELAKAAPTFNNLPFLRRHVALDAQLPKKEEWIGTTGEKANFSDPYLTNSLTIWDAAYIATLEAADRGEAGGMKELSCAYRYRADMTPGVSGGVAYDGIMRSIEGNHVALVEAGRAGSDVVVGDAKLEIGPVSDKTAKDESEEERKEREAKERAEDKRKAKDAEPEKKPACDAEEEDDDEDDKKKREKKDDDDDEGAEDAPYGTSYKGKTPSHWQGKRVRRSSPRRAHDDDPENTNGAMDERIRLATDAAVTATVQRLNARDEAKRAVRSRVGEVLGMDSAEEVYRFALKHEGIDPGKITGEGLADLWRAAAKPDRSARIPALAMDQAETGFLTRFPTAARIAF